ncbi:MAG TPA: hypothetical protein VM095_18470 [Pyrinomonadaceae bacterium]|nr:hypothetical protein [Pyrinomonadaceae bacterium]
MKTVAGELGPLWAAGLALACLLLSCLVWGTGLRLEGEAYEWAVYLSLGTLFPALLLMLALPKLFPRIDTGALDTLKTGLGMLCVVVSTIFIVRQHQYTAFGLSLVQLFLVIAFQKRAGLLMTPALILIDLFVVVLAWTISARLLWWDSLGHWFISGSGGAESVYRFLICALSLLLVLFNVMSREKAVDGARPRIWTIPNAAAVLILGAASVRSDQLFNTMSYSHWGVIIGPAEMVRQGGWLLWDVPSQYGFLNILAVAIFPVKSVWQSSYIINSLLLFSSAVFLFYVLRSLMTGPLNFCFALSATLAAVFLMAGWPPALLGPQVFPSLGPFRFIWCYALLLILFQDYRRKAEKPDWRLMLAGCVIWLIGTLWSSESAVYCAAIWLPAYALIIFRKARDLRAEAPPHSKSRLRVVAFWSMVPPLLLATSIGLITAYYILRLGHAPDWRGFYEYSLSFSKGFFAIPIDPDGPVWTLFLIFCALSTLAAYSLRQGLTHRAASLIAGTWGALWAVGSYFVSRSHPNNVAVLSPVLVTVIGLTLFIVAAHRQSERWAALVKMSFVPILTIILTATFGNASFLGLYLSSPKLGYERDIDSHLPVIDPALQDLLKMAEVKTDDAIVYSAVRVKAVEPLADGLSHDHGVLLPAWPVEEGRQLLSSHRAWLPTTPFVLFAPLPLERRQLYMARFTARRRLSGWLIQNRKEASYTSSAWFYDQLLRTHTPTKTFENNDWQVIWFERKQAED